MILLIKKSPHLDIVNNFFIHSYFQSHSNSPLSFTDWVAWTIGITRANWQKNGAQINLFWNNDVFIFTMKTTKISFIALLWCIKIILSLLGFLSFFRYIWFHINASASKTQNFVIYITISMKIEVRKNHVPSFFLSYKISSVQL